MVDSSLKNKILISTRPKKSAAELKKLIIHRDAILYELPTISIKGIISGNSITESIKQLSSYEWLVFTSMNGIKYFFENLNHLSVSKDELKNIKTAVIGSKTAKTLEEYGVIPDFKGKRGTGDEFAKALKEYILNTGHNNVKILLPSSNLSANNLPEILSSIGKVDKIAVYETVSSIHNNKEIVDKIKNEKYDAILFFSPSAVEGLLNNLNSCYYKNIKAACIGSTTANKLKSYGIRPLTIADESDSKGMITALENYYKQINQI